ncbi:2-keto-3-deoxy-6-phosphogluconate aldolase [Synechococcus sp. PROS-9-1]|uniref:bifunctional 4-hydroxy-2-oxoglutarate aldolase/2-dehydro-3-deoxy-phosphogluconate aldolase n=1 Tax=Synechococcus sp. PROS-9-1 TaxID=1968775 RepID=UPI0016491563|nr:bifunctional 4-hydroxy-2-oxoglutarate aldolase/2-dehydro-3-deoxy-phosphogluconate aldolase [Synechococcus sp. PROS-9-1]QNJ30794.1 2-keto-3-deoxy-6-phosphogluconate aldolase [Synechococcus sp. PROS-9-1]
MYELLSTSDRQQWLMASLRRQPLIIVLRPKESDLLGPFLQSLLCHRLDQLVDLGVRHIEIAWMDHLRWSDLIATIRLRHPTVQLGVASVTSQRGLQAVIDLDLPYAMSPLLDQGLVSMAHQHNCCLVPGVMTPTEIRQALVLGCHLVKLFPALVLGLDYHRQISAPMGDLPFMIAAGGLTVADLDPWLSAGYDAIALGRGVLNTTAAVDDLRHWLT